MHAKHSFASFLLDLAVSAAQKRSTGAFLLAYPLPPTAFGGRDHGMVQIPPAAGGRQKEKPTRLGWFSFWLRRWDLNLTTSGL